MEKESKFKVFDSFWYNISCLGRYCMPYFTIFQSNLFPSYDLSVEEKRKLDTFLCVLEDSEVWKIIKEETEKDN